MSVSRHVGVGLAAQAVLVHNGQAADNMAPAVMVPLEKTIHVGVEVVTESGVSQRVQRGLRKGVSLAGVVNGPVTSHEVTGFNVGRTLRDGI